MKNQRVYKIAFVFVIASAIVYISHTMDSYYVVNDNRSVPLFGTPSTELEYEIGEHGTNCYKLWDVLIPNTQIKVVGSENGKVSRVEYWISDKSKGTGYVHNDFLKNSCTKKYVFGKKLDERDAKVSPMPLEKIRKVFDRCIKDSVPYCYGGNNFEAIELPGDYKFTPVGENADKKIKYTLRGFDCSGILFYISNGGLPHCVNGLDKSGTTIFTFNYTKDNTREEKENVLNMLRDTDYLVFLHNKDRSKTSGNGHVVVSYNGGIIEFRGKDYGCVYADSEHAMERLDSMIAASKRSCSDLLVIRWHPEVMNDK